MVVERTYVRLLQVVRGNQALYICRMLEQFTNKCECSVIRYQNTYILRQTVTKWSEVRVILPPVVCVWFFILSVLLRGLWSKFCAWLHYSRNIHTCESC